MSQALASIASLPTQYERRAVRAEGRLVASRIADEPFDPELGVAIEAGYCLDAPEEIPTGSTSAGWVMLGARQGAAVRWIRRG